MNLRTRVVAYVGVSIAVCWVLLTSLTVICAQSKEDRFRDLVFLTDHELNFVGSEWAFMENPKITDTKRWPEEELDRQLQGMGDWLLAPTKFRENTRNYKTLFIHVVSIETVANAEASETFQHVEAWKNEKGHDDLFTWFRLGNVSKTPKIRVCGMLQRKPGVDSGPHIIEAHRHFSLENDKWVEVESKHSEP